MKTSEERRRGVTGWWILRIINHRLADRFRMNTEKRQIDLLTAYQKERAMSKSRAAGGSVCTQK